MKLSSVQAHAMLHYLQSLPGWVRYSTAPDDLLLQVPREILENINKLVLTILNQQDQTLKGLSDED